jgi:hypothetical protein
MADVHVGDIGTLFGLTVMEGRHALDVSAATDKRLIFRKPDGVCVAKEASFSSDGEDGRLQYVSESDFVDQAGEWSVQAVVTLETGLWHSEAVTFSVVENLCADPTEPD